MAKGGGAGLAILLVGGLAVLLLFSGTIISFVSGLPSQFQDFIDQIRGGLPGAGGDVSGATWIGYKVFYEDGTFEEIRQDAPTFSLVPLSITFGAKGKNVSSVQVDLKAKLSSSDSMGAWKASLTMQTEIYKHGESTPKTSATVLYSKNGPSWSSGETKILASYTVQASTLEGLVKSYGDGAWQLQFLGHVNLTVKVNDVPVVLSAASPAGGMDFNYVNAVPQSLSVFGKGERFGQ